jgi:hypothetical protein
MIAAMAQFFATDFGFNTLQNGEIFVIVSASGGVAAWAVIDRPYNADAGIWE